MSSKWTFQVLGHLPHLHRLMQEGKSFRNQKLGEDVKKGSGSGVDDTLLIGLSQKQITVVNFLEAL